MADPGFTVGGMDPWGDVDLRSGCFSVKMFAKTKELGPEGGRGCANGFKGCITSNICDILKF